MVELEQTLLGDDDRRREFDERRPARCRSTGGNLDLFLQTVVVETERRSGAADAVGLDQADGQRPKRRWNPAAAVPLLPPGLKPAPPLQQILGQRPTLRRSHRGPPKTRTPTLTNQPGLFMQPCRKDTKNETSISLRPLAQSLLSQVRDLK